MEDIFVTLKIKVTPAPGMPTYARPILEQEFHKYFQSLEPVPAFLRDAKADVELVYAEVTGLNPNLAAVHYTPEAIRQHFDGKNTDDYADLDSNGAECARLLEDGIDDEKLHQAATEWLCDNDPLWEDFHRGCVEIVKEAARPAEVDIQ